MSNKELTLAGPPAPVQAFTLTPRSFDEAMQFADIMAKSDLVPKDYKGKPGNILVAIQKGYEVGLSPMAALESIAVINGRASIWGDGLLGIVQANAMYEWHKESFNDATMTATFTVKRKGNEPHTTTFSKADALQAKTTEWVNNQKITRTLWDKDTYQSYPKRMLQMRARGFGLRDQFADALKGLIAAEEAIDIPITEEITAEIQPAAPATLKDRLREQAAEDVTPEVKGTPAPEAQEPAKPAPKDAKPTARKAPAKAEPPKATAPPAKPEPAKDTQAPPAANLVAYNDYLAGFDGIPVTDTEKAIALMKSACEDIRLLDGDYAKLEDFFYGRYATIKRPGK